IGSFRYNRMFNFQRDFFLTIKLQRGPIMHNERINYNMLSRIRTRYAFSFLFLDFYLRNMRYGNRLRHNSCRKEYVYNSNNQIFHTYINTLKNKRFNQYTKNKRSF